MPRRHLDFRGCGFDIACIEEDGYQHPSWFSFEDEKDVREHFWRIEPGDVVLDVGAAYGSYTLTALASGARHVFAWSPEGRPGEPSERAMLTMSLELNGWQSLCTIFEYGCCDRSGWLDPLTQAFGQCQEPGRILVAPLDDYLSGDATLHFGRGPYRVWMKIDVEGAEIEVLRGAHATIQHYRPRILVENHLFKRATLEEEVRELLTGCGYQHIESRPYHSVSHSLYVPS